MSDIVLQAKDISKLYKLGTIGSGSLRKDVQQWFDKSILNKQDPYLKRIDEEQVISRDHLWALRDVNFEIKEGEAWGFIGRNGAGKSTMLKILSRIVKPTTGTIKGKGKVSSLLEVGTGFHQELSGKENIFISGHILGMKRSEILKKFDEIVEFSGVENFLDTPVKRYSSGMYVRLAFAVAAHLEPDILIVDEVLAVGDAEFQKKCMGKMKEASSSKGRTIIFVSHNLQAINNLCTNAIWLDAGKIRGEGDAKSVVNKYLSVFQEKTWKREFKTTEEVPGNENIKVLAIELVPHLDDPLGVINIKTALTVKFRFYNAVPNVRLSVDLLLFTLAEECIFDVPSIPFEYREGIIEGECTIPGNFLNEGSYYFNLHFAKDTFTELFSYEQCLFFDVVDYKEGTNWYEKWWGYVRPNFPVTLKPIENTD